MLKWVLPFNYKARADTLWGVLIQWSTSHWDTLSHCHSVLIHLASCFGYNLSHLYECLYVMFVQNVFVCVHATHLFLLHGGPPVIIHLQCKTTLKLTSQVKTARVYKWVCASVLTGSRKSVWVGELRSWISLKGTHNMHTKYKGLSSYCGDSYTFGANHLLIWSECMNLPKLFSQVPCCLCLSMT